MKQRYGELIETGRRNPLLVVLLTAAALFFLLYYLTDPARPAGIFNTLGYHDNAQYPLGWFGFYDQSQYLSISHVLASFKLSQLHHAFTYGLGYPLVAVPFIWLGFNSDPFLFFNLFTFVFTIYATYRVAKWLISPLAGYFAAFGLLFASPLIHYVDEPWNSTVCLFVMSVLLIILTVKKLRLWHYWLVGLMLGWAFAARYVDIVWLTPMALACLYRGSFKNLVKPVVFLLIGALIFVIPVLYAQDKIFGSPFKTPYINHIGIGGKGGSDQGLKAYSIKRIPKAAVALFSGPRLEGSSDVDRGFLMDAFWILAAIPGAYLLIKKRRSRLFVVTFIIFGLIACLFYLSFRASTPGSLKYGELHYFKMLWPFSAVLATAFIYDLATRSRSVKKG